MASWVVPLAVFVFHLGTRWLLMAEINSFKIALKVKSVIEVQAFKVWLIQAVVLVSEIDLFFSVTIFSG